MARAPRKSASAPDPTIYPSTDHMGESLLHRELADTLRFLLVALSRASEASARAGEENARREEAERELERLRAQLARAPKKKR